MGVTGEISGAAAMAPAGMIAVGAMGEATMAVGSSDAGDGSLVAIRAVVE
jgi:hypothetical protein